MGNVVTKEGSPGAQSLGANGAGTSANGTDSYSGSSHRRSSSASHGGSGQRRHSSSGGGGTGSGSGNGSSAGNIGLPGSHRRRLGGSGNSARERERERRHRERHEGYQLIIDPSEKVDGGYLFPQGVYSGPQDFKVSVVRDCIIRRRLAPFYKGLDEVDPEWSDETLLEAIYGSSASGSASAIPGTNLPTTKEKSDAQLVESVGDLSIDILSGPKSLPRHFSSGTAAAHVGSGTGTAAGTGAGTGATTTTPINRARSHTMGQLREASQWQKEQEDTQQIWLYRNVHECPICFLVYPRLNTTRCCGQDICTECFVQIKRTPPHPPYDPPQENNPQGVVELVSEPVSCPYCAQPNFGVIFDAPPFEWGIPKPGHEPELKKPLSGSGTRPRRTSLPSSHPDVVTVDMIRPDWESKLASARRRLLRKSAAARALHENALLPPPASPRNGSSGGSNSSSPRSQNYNDLVRSTHGLSAAQTRELERRMIDEAIRASLQTS